jgi:hypothetical protein
MLGSNRMIVNWGIQSSSRPGHAQLATASGYTGLTIHPKSTGRCLKFKGYYSPAIGMDWIW